MLKAPLMASLFASLFMGLAVADNVKAEPRPERDTRIIVEVDRELDTLTEEGVNTTQLRVINNIKQYATSNFSVSTKFHNIANAFVLDVNKNDVEAIKNVPGVKSVTLDQIHWVTSIPTEVENEGVLEEEEEETDYGGSDNVSAQTMSKPDDTNDGEGTVIAILDNEFYFRGVSYSDEGLEQEAWLHETFSPLADDVAVKFNGRPANLTKTNAYKAAVDSDVAIDNPGLVGKDGKTLYNTTLGKEGSFYLNNKVPFYFDYGGEKRWSSDDPHKDWDVSSTISYHGSHVASIAAGNAETYKGIAPKAQLVCMKVFTNYKASAIDTQLGLGSSSGAYDVPILTALEDCITLGVDGINMSLGSNLDDFDGESITLKTLTRLANAGILTSISAGNSGKSSYASLGSYANWTRDMVETGILSSYSNNADVMTIASGQPDRIFYKSAFKLAYQTEAGTVMATIAYEDQIVNREGYDKDYQKEFKMEDLLDGDKTKTLDWVYVKGFGQESDYDQPADYYAGKVVVVNRGSTSFADKYAIARSKQAKALVIINNDPTASDFNFRCSFGDGFKPTMPCALVLFKDKEVFEGGKSGHFNIIANQIDENPYTKTVSSFSSDGATYDLDLKPDITAPGENIRGAIPPQKAEDREKRHYSTYEFLSGTSMSAPNYAGVQSVVLSKAAAPVYRASKESGKAPSKQELAAISDFAKTVDMRLMSTAEPMKDIKENPEDKTYSLSSPRRQGAGMANIDKAYHTDVYLEGVNEAGKGIGKSKVVLKNNADIANGKVAISFIGHNESNQTKNYNVVLTVMRPAIAATNDIITKEYNNRGEVSEIENFPGYSYWEVEGMGDFAKNVQRTSSGPFAYRDVFEATKDIEYYATEQDLIDQKPTVIAKGKYYNAGDDKVADWQPLPTEDYQSAMDVVLAKVNLQTIAIKPGDNSYTLNTWSLDDEMKAAIKKYYTYGCYIEGYVSLNSTESTGIDLSMPFLGYYKDYSKAPVVEPFNFEKKNDIVYPSDLANTLTKTLLGKDKVDMSSMMLAGYVEPGKEISTDRVLYNNDNFKNYSGFYEVGTDAATGELFDNAKNNIYVGGPESTNTLIVQQFVLRSVKDNYFTITNKSTKEVVYKSVLEDMIYGDYWGTYPLYKSHVNDSFLGAGIVCTRALAIIPLYNVNDGSPLASGDYEISFNYILAGTSSTITNTYTLHIDSDAPLITEAKFDDESVRIYVQEKALASAVIGKYTKEFVKEGNNKYFVEFSRAELEQHLQENMNAQYGSGRLYIGLTDQARNKMGALMRFNHKVTDNVDDITFNMIQHKDLGLTNDFRYRGGELQVVKYDAKKNRYDEVELSGIIGLLDGNYVVTSTEHTKTITVKVCGGSVMATSIVLASIAAVGIALVLANKISKKRKEGGNF